MVVCYNVYMTTNTPTPIVTTKVRSTFRTFIAAVVGALIAWASSKWGHLDTGVVASIVPVVAGLYYAGITSLEKKFPIWGGC